jgi:peptide/nickel transport system ATP-binding protein/oligopeptide transport system ATP-binding protein
VTSPAEERAYLEITDACIEYAVGRRRLIAVDNASLAVPRATTFGLIGESGSGKSTLARFVMGLVHGTGTVRVGDHVVDNRPRSGRRRQSVLPIQMIVQDPHSALDPRLSVGASVAEPLRVRGGVSRRQSLDSAMAMLERVGLSTHLGKRYPHQLSGGQKQRVNIARALISEPEVLICDESVSALDVALQAEILNLLTDLQRDFGLTMLFISHDLSVIAHLADRIGVMYLGQIVELSDAHDLLTSPSHPYTEALIAAKPEPVPQHARQRTRIILEGEIPSPLSPPSGCRFRTRCRYARDMCVRDRPLLRSVAQGSWVACHFAEEIHLQGAAMGAEQTFPAVSSVPLVHDANNGGST